MRPLRVLAVRLLVIIVLIVLIVFVMLIVLIVTMIVLVAIVIGISRVDVGCSRRFRCTFLLSYKERGAFPIRKAQAGGAPLKRRVAPS